MEKGKSIRFDMDHLRYHLNQIYTTKGPSFDTKNRMFKPISEVQFDA